MEKSSTISVIHTYFEAVNWGSMQDAADLLAPGAAWEVPALNVTHTGPCGYLAGQQTWRRAFPDAWLDMRDIKFGENWATACYTLRGKHAGLLDTALGVVTPTGREIALAVCDVFEVAYGRIIRINSFFDTATLMRQLGMMPQLEARPFSLNLAN